MSAEISSGVNEVRQNTIYQVDKLDGSGVVYQFLSAQVEWYQLTQWNAVAGALSAGGDLFHPVRDPRLQIEQV